MLSLWAKLRVVTAVLLAALPAAAMAAEELSPSLRQAPLVFAAVLKSAQAGPVARSFPPIYNYKLTFENAEKPLRGALPKELTFHFSSRTVDPPTFDVGGKYVVAVQLGEGARVLELRPATKEFIEQVKSALSLPIGWTMVDGKVTSPWAARGEKAWPKDSTITADKQCAITGRPALLAGEGIQLKVEQVPPKDLQEFKNPFGDGQFKLTVTNTSKMTVTVPALLKAGDEILWDDSLVIVCQNKPYVLPSKKQIAPTGMVELAPGESVSTVVDTLLLPDEVPWPRGGSRIAFTFALGEAAADNFFYYFSNLHDGLRKISQEAAAKGR